MGLIIMFFYFLFEIIVLCAVLVICNSSALLFICFNYWASGEGLLEGRNLPLESGENVMHMYMHAPGTQMWSCVEGKDGEGLSFPGFALGFLDRGLEDRGPRTPATKCCFNVPASCGNGLTLTTVQRMERPSWAAGWEPESLVQSWDTLLYL